VDEQDSVICLVEYPPDILGPVATFLALQEWLDRLLNLGQVAVYEQWDFLESGEGDVQTRTTPDRGVTRRMAISIDKDDDLEVPRIGGDGGQIRGFRSFVRGNGCRRCATDGRCRVGDHRRIESIARAATSRDDETKH
jgi:hypothetical protein